MFPFKIGKLRGGYAVYWEDTPGDRDSRRRFQLKATNLKDAWPEGMRRYEAEMTLKGDDLDFSDIWGSYVDSLKGQRSYDDLNYMWNQLGPFFENYHPLQINDQLVAKYKADRRQGFFEKHGREMSNGTLRSEIGAVQTALNFAYKKNIIEKPQTLKRPPKPAPKDRWLREHEIMRLLEASKETPHLQVAIVLLLSTAGRVGAVLDLTWDRVDFENRTIDLRVDTGKAAKGRAFIPMNDGAFEVLSRWRPFCETKYVVEYQMRRIHTIRSSFETAAELANLEDVTPHVLRHTAAVHMVANGCAMQRVSQYLGHTSLAMTEKVYARFAPDHLREESQALDFLRGKSADLIGIPIMSKK